MRQPTKIKRISVAKETISLLAAKYGVSNVMVYNALAGRTNSNNAKKIRESAVNEYGGRYSTIQIF